MEANRLEQLEALGVMRAYNTKLINNIPILARELEGEKKEDTDTYLKSILDVINWITSVVGATLDVLNEDKERFDKEAFNAALTEINEAESASDDKRLAQGLRNIVPCFESLEKAINEVV